jgi:hypothetical protein
MANFYEVQEFTIADGWANTWASPENWAYYNTEAEAQSDLDYYLAECAAAAKSGFMADAPDRAAFRVVMLPQDQNPLAKAFQINAGTLK